MRFRTLAVTVAALLTGGAAAQPRNMATHPRLAPLQPPPGALADYEADLQRTFRDAFGADVRLRAVVRPSFQTEYAVGLRQDGEGYEIFALRPSRQIWAYQMIKLYKSGQAGVMIFDGSDGDDPDKLLGDPDSEPRDGTADAIAQLQKDLPADPSDLPLSRCAVTVDDAVAAGVTAAWRRMLETVRPGEQLMPGLDGTSYIFSMETDGGALAGETWSPRAGTRPAKLARLAEAMREYCETKAAEPLAEIRNLAHALARRRRA
ncbi:MAG TPA: hypothetical protein VFZ91_08625 [Allosphingosinicella sp.]